MWPALREVARSADLDLVPPSQLNVLSACPALASDRAYLEAEGLRELRRCIRDSRDGFSPSLAHVAVLGNRYGPPRGIPEAIPAVEFAKLRALLEKQAKGKVTKLEKEEDRRLKAAKLQKNQRLQANALSLLSDVRARGAVYAYQKPKSTTAESKALTAQLRTLLRLDKRGTIPPFFSPTVSTSVFEARSLRRRTLSFTAERACF